jgi:hypothetical protein
MFQFCSVFSYLQEGGGIVPNGLFIFKSGMKIGDCRDEMNAGNFTKYTYILS